ncbi:MAG TPA: hypothetical protein VFO76_01230 [Candidatus Kapabacteria bacterium]|nr:hypothetical protein [Candidatus Kapabacteria bacterium]
MDYLQEHPLYVVAIIAAAIWVGIFIFMMMLSGKVSKLEKNNS